MTDQASREEFRVTATTKDQATADTFAAMWGCPFSPVEGGATLTVTGDPLPHSVAAWRTADYYRALGAETVKVERRVISEWVEVTE